MKHLSRTLKFRLSAGSCTQRANCTNMVFFCDDHLNFIPTCLFLFSSHGYDEVDCFAVCVSSRHLSIV